LTRTTGVIVARLDRLKGHDVLLKALAWMKEDAELLIVGDGPERGALEVLAAELGVQDRVRFAGFRKDVPDLLAASDFFVLPSRTEGLPLSVLEAMAHGLPSIATPVGGVPEALNGEECGILVPVDDVHRLAAVMGTLVGDPQLRRRLGAAAETRVRKHFSFAAMTDAYDSLYRRLLRGERCGS
jgi:glycosyltransferase involved in cell wall biosynthesis